jgi:hypothetical protein
LMVQLPYSSSDAVVPETVHTAGVVEENVTGRFELADADRATLLAATCPLGMAVKVMVCVDSVTEKLCPTFAAEL